MSLPMTYSRRKRIREQAGIAPVLRDDLFGRKLIVQILQIFRELEVALKSDVNLPLLLVDYLRKEMGVMALAVTNDRMAELTQWFSNEKDTSDQETFYLRLDTIENACAYATAIAGKGNSTTNSTLVQRKVQALIGVLNARMLEDGFGYQFVGQQLIQLTSQFEYEEVVLPALALISDPMFEAANGEFRGAFEAFKHASYEDCVVDCAKAFESVLKVIAAKRGWGLDSNANASKLIDAAVSQGLFPSYLKEQFTGLKMMLQGAPTVRNKDGAHGAGETVRTVEKRLAAYQLHQTAAVIIFLAESHAAQP